MLKFKIICLLDKKASNMARLFFKNHLPMSRVSFCDNFRQVQGYLSNENPDFLLMSTRAGNYNTYYFYKSIAKRFSVKTILFDDVNNVKYNSRFKSLDIWGFLDHRDFINLDHFSTTLTSLLCKKVHHDHFTRASQKSYRLIVIGASTGGPETLRELIGQLRNDLPPIVIALHIPRKFSKLYADQLNLSSSLVIKEAEDREIARFGHAYITPGESHLSCKKKYQQQCVFSIQEGRGEHLFCPSVDILFNSAAESFKHEVISVILTGMGKDGAEGMLTLKNSGAITIAQDEESCVVYGMPRAAYEIGAVGSVLSIKKIAKFINTIAYNSCVSFFLTTPFICNSPI